MNLIESISKTFRVTQAVSEEQVNVLEKTLRFAKNMTGKHTIFTRRTLKRRVCQMNWLTSSLKLPLNNHRS